MPADWRRAADTARRPLATLRRVGVAPVIRGLWLSRHFEGHAPVYWVGGFPAPRVAKERGGRLLTDGVSLFSGVRLEIGSEGTLSIGKGTYLERGTKIVCHDQVTIGRDCQISWDVVIMDSDQHARAGIASAVAPVSIGDDVWIGCRAIVLKGVAIGDGAVIGAGAIVTRDVPPSSLAVGQPARVIRTLEDPEESADQE